jgi:hypothetical protein
MPAYRRGQVEWALWQYFAGDADKSRVPQIFLTRVKRLLEIDRQTKGYRSSQMPHARFAFMDTRPQGKGIDSSYSAFDAFCLAVGLDLLDTGFKQSEVVLLLRHIRLEFAKQYEHAMRNPIMPRMRIAAEDRPGCPSYENKGVRFADCRIFALIQKVEIKEAFPSVPRGLPLILRPTFCHGVQALTEEMKKMNYDYRKVLVLELAHTAVMVTDHLKKAPDIRRGRG